MIAAEQIEQISSVVKEQGLDEVVLTGLREKFPGIHFTYCMDDDVCGPKPVHESEGFNIYLVDGHDHCMAFTQNAEIATGVVLAEVEDDEE
jgi:hypothetical protein